ncbi:MAG: YceI family protein [Bacteroidota bacterium]
MKMHIVKIALFAVMMMIGVSSSNAQQVYNLSAGSELKVSGTSTLHDWTMKSTSGSGKATFTMAGDQLQSISSLSVSLKVQSLKSGKSGMDDKAYEALKAKENPTITFTLREMKNLKQSGSAITYTAIGDLTVSGVKRAVTFTGTGKAVADKFQFDGKTSFKLTDFKMDPPTAMFGTIKTGDDVTVSFNVTFKNSATL